MKKSRIFFSALLILTLLAAPACADMFYLCERDGMTKVAAFTVPNLIWGDYPVGLEFESGENHGGVCLSSFVCGEVNWMFTSAYDKTASKQYAYLYPYRYKGWGELLPESQRVELADSRIWNPRGAIQLDNFFYIIDRGENNSSTGTLTLYEIAFDETTNLPKFTKKTALTFDSVALSVLEPGDVAHPEAIFTATANDEVTLFVLFSVTNGTTVKNNVLASIKYENDALSVVQSMLLKTEGFDGLAHKPSVCSIKNELFDGTFIFLACENTVEMVDINAMTSTELYTKGSGEEDWETLGLKFTDVVVGSSNAYLVAEGTPDNQTFYVRAYAPALNDFLAEDKEGKPLAPFASLSDNAYHQTSAFLDSYLGNIYLFLGDYIYLYNKKYSESEIGGSFVTASPCYPYINQPTSQDYGSGGSGCNAGCSAAMLLFCAAPLFFRKKR